MAYLAILTGGYLGKWDKELKNPYLFLLPDSPAKKMWYATVMEHVKAAIDGAILVLPLGIAWKVHPFHMVSCWLIYVFLQAIKLYTKVLIDSFLRNSLGRNSKAASSIGSPRGNYRDRSAPCCGCSCLTEFQFCLFRNFNLWYDNGSGDWTVDSVKVRHHGTI